MKSGRIRTLRGSIASPMGVLKRQLILDDGRPNHGLKVLSFQMWSDVSTNISGISASLSLEVTPAGLSFFDAADNRQIAWFTSAFDYTGASPFAIAPFVVIDPNHVVNESLFIEAFCSPNVNYSYLIVCEEYTLSDDEAIISLIKERSQNVA